MKLTMNRSAVIILLMLCIGIFATCEFTKQIENMTRPETTDTLFLSQWRREKQEKINLIASYEKKITSLETFNDSLKKTIEGKKKVLSAYRFRERILQERLAENVSQRDSAITVRDSLPNLVDSLIVSSHETDTACDETITSLESQVANRDSVIALQKQVEDNTRDLKKEAELRNQYLTDQLNIAFKNQRKKSRQNKLLAGGILLLSGITTSILLTQTLK